MARSKIREVAKARDTTPQKLLIDLYDLYGSQRMVAKVLGVSPSTVSVNLMRFRLKEHTVLREEKSA